MSEPIRRSPLTAAHAALGASFRREGSWELVVGYAGERSPAASPMAVAEITPRGKVDVRGAAGALGVEDAFAATIASDWTLVLGPPDAEERLIDALEATGSGALVTDATHLYVGFALAGPRSDDAFARLTAFDVASLAPGAAAATAVLDVPAILVRRDLGLPVVEAYVGTEFAAFAWSGFLETATELGGGPVGWPALRNAGWR